jgi:hypothetical protein
LEDREYIITGIGEQLDLGQGQIQLSLDKTTTLAIIAPLGFRSDISAR